MYLLDSNILSNLMRQRPSPGLVARLAGIPPQRQFTASTVIAELIYGAERDLLNRAARLQQIEQFLGAGLAVLPFDTEAATRYGFIRAELERRGQRLEDHDLQIAAVTLVRHLTLVTANVRHFARVPDLSVENWLD
jgi:predicted nucleic acid-binding protein